MAATVAELSAPTGPGSSSDPEGLRQYFVQKIEELNLVVADRHQNLRRLQAQRNELNAKVRMLREELQLLVSSRPSIILRGLFARASPYPMTCLQARLESKMYLYSKVPLL